VIRFAFELAAKGLSICDPVYYEGKLWFMVGNELVVINPAAGKIEKRTYVDVLGRSSASNIAINNRYLYVAGATKRLHALVKDGMWMEFQVTADDNSVIRSIKANDSIVVFSTQTGHVVGMTSTGPKRLWQVDVIGQIWSSMVMEDQWVYVGSANTKLYKFNIESGQRGWVLPVQLGDVIVKPCRVGKNTIYQKTANGDIFGVDKEKGEILWKVAKGIGFVTEKGQNAYILAKPGILHVMNNKTGKKEFSVNFSNVSDAAVNLVDSTIYVSDERGRLAAVIKE
jgi:outer membrane protein assembly factor BamB